MLRAILVCAAALGCFSLAFLAQPSAAQPDKKTEPAKGKEDPNKAGKDPGKTKTADKSGDGGKNGVKPMTPLDRMRLPTNAIVVVVEDLLKARELIPSQWILPYDDWLALKDRIKVLEQQLKGDRVLPSSCKLVGKLDGDFLVVDAEYVFATGPMKTTVPLGLQGGHLLKEGQLGKQAAILDIDKDDGFIARVEKEGSPHRLVVTVRVPVKKSLTGGLERSIDLGLPPSAATFLHLDLPSDFEDVRWNGHAEKAKKPGHWEIGLDRSKSLNLAWKEPLPTSANSALVNVETQIKVEVDATHLNITTDYFLEDRRKRTEEWHVYLPAQAKVEAVKGPPGLIPGVPTEKTPYAIVRVPPTSERWQVTVSQRVPRPNPGVKTAIGPYQVLGALHSPGGALQIYGPSQHHGTITVKMPGEVSLGQRLVFTRFGKINQTKNAETEAVFQYVGPAAADLNLKAPQPFKAPLDLEWRFEKNQLRTEVEHDLKLKTTTQGYEVDAISKIRVTALFATVGAIDLKLPQPLVRGVAITGNVNPSLAFPGALPWAGIGKTFFMPWTYVNPDEPAVTDKSGNPIKLVPLDPFGKTRILWTGGAGKQAILELKSSFRIPAQNRHLRLELPRPLNTQDRAAKLSIQADDRIELLHGPEGAEEPVPERHRFDLNWDQAPGMVELAWRPHHREIVSHATIDIELHDRIAQVQQTLRFPRDRAAAGPEAKMRQVKLKAPRGIDKISLASNGEIIHHDRALETLWVNPGADAGDTVDLKLLYDLPVVNQSLEVTPIWPAHGSQEDVKVRVWTSPGRMARLTPELLQRGVWKERSIELVRDHEQFPSLVLAGYGANLPLRLEIDDSSSARPAAFMADRVLVQARVAEDGSQQIQARYFIRTINAAHIDLELPLPLTRFRKAPTFFLGKHRLTQWENLDAKVLRLQLHPELATLPAVLEITYSIPADALERGSVWSTTLHAPVFRSDVVLGQMRWHLTTASPLIAASFGRNVYAETQWSVQGWLLTPEAATQDPDAWLNGKDLPGPPATFAFAHVSLQPETVYHLPRQWWILGCSGIFLILTLGTYFSPLPRWTFWLLLATLAASLTVFTLLCPAAWPGIAFGLQPGIALLLLFVSVHMLVQERYRRQLVFLPGFTRPKTGSTITRTNVAKRPREASTVDAPPGALDAPSATSAAPPSGT